MSEATYPTTWTKPKLIPSPVKRYGLYVLIAVYLALAVRDIEFDWGRMTVGLERGWAFLSGFFHPDLRSRWEEIVIGMKESLTMTVVASVAGILISVPFGLGAAKNISHPVVYFFCRTVIAFSRSFQEVIIAILFVAMFGFGPFAGFLTIVVATIGFLGKLIAEAIEDIDPAQVEAIRATGASWGQTFNYGVQPQIMPRFVGLCMYRLDINFRESAVVGIVGAGGIGATLNTAIERYEFDVAAGILLLIIAIVIALEYASAFVRKRAQ
ncbi:phosphonate ABC transporter, permease protein PhnE [Deltaproteobacteria bacterium PRO3]|nr:phosphonate ABC transporter, permease protein PhnE [Deltaproteobacteria bacterium PRO3]